MTFVEVASRMLARKAVDAWDAPGNRISLETRIVEQIRAAVAEEREAILEIVEEEGNGGVLAGERIARRIRARRDSAASLGEGCE